MEVKFRVSDRIAVIMDADAAAHNLVMDYMESYDFKNKRFPLYKLPAYKLKKLYDLGIAKYDKGYLSILNEDLWVVEPEKRVYTDNGCIYIAFDDREWYKIGYTTMFRDSKEMCMKTYNPYIRIIYMAKGTSSDELFLHKKFADKRKVGEWFDLTDSDIEWIKSNFKVVNV